MRENNHVQITLETKRTCESKEATDCGQKIRFSLLFPLLSRPSSPVPRPAEPPLVPSSVHGDDADEKETSEE
jgi:hypothetical protein